MSAAAFVIGVSYLVFFSGAVLALARFRARAAEYEITAWDAWSRLMGVPVARAYLAFVAFGVGLYLTCGVQHVSMSLSGGHVGGGLWGGLQAASLFAGAAFAPCGAAASVVAALYADRVATAVHKAAGFDAEGARANDAVDALWALLADHPLPHVRLDPAAPVTGAVFLDVNAAACERWGRTREELTTRPYIEFVSAATAERTAEVTARIDAGDGGYDGFINAYGVPGRPEAWSRWRAIGATGISVAEPYDAEIRAKDAEDERDLARRRALAAAGPLGDDLAARAGNHAPSHGDP